MKLRNLLLFFVFVGSFFGVYATECDVTPLFNSKKSSLAVIGANLHLGQPRTGTERAYKWLKGKGLIPYLKSKFAKGALDAGTIEQVQGVPDDLFSNTIFNKARNFPQISTFNRLLADQVSKLNTSYDLTLTIGGDHSMAMGSVAGSLKANPNTRVIWVDAHADINTPMTSPSGNVHGMPLSFLTGYFRHPETDAHLEWMPRLDPANLAIIGLRDVDAEEPAILKELGILNYSAEDVKNRGVPAILDEVMNKLDDGKSPFHMSFDVDSIDPSLMPCTGTAVAGGLTLGEGKNIMGRVFQTGRLKTLDVVEINPSLGDHVDRARTCMSAFQLLDAL